MQTKIQVLCRIRILYYVFAVVLIGSIITGVMGRDFRAGFKEGYEMAEGNKDGQHIRHYHYLEADIANSGYDIPILTTPDNSLIVQGKINVLDLKVRSAEALRSGTDIVAMFLIFFSSFMYIAVFVLLFLILNSLRKSSKNDHVFAHVNIKRTRAIGILLIGASIFSEVGMYLDNLSAVALLQNTPYKVLPGIPIDFGGLILGVMMLVVAEMFVIGYGMSEEEKLTI